METRVYQKESNFKLFKLFRESLVDIWSSRFLARQLAERDIKAQYRQSYLGILWAFINPLATAAVWIVLNLSGTVKVTDSGIPYPLFAFTGTLLFSILSESINSPLRSTNSARGVLSKVNFPKEALIVSGIYKLIFNSIIKIALLIIFVFLFGIGFHWSLLLLPVAILSVILMGTCLGLLITPMGLLFNDFDKVLGMGLSFFMYVTPVVYPIPKDGLMRTIMSMNPVTPVIVTARDLLMGIEPAFLNYFIIINMICIPLLIIGLLIYRVSIPVIVERISA